jgi:hypothetical protein
MSIFHLKNEKQSRWSLERFMDARRAASAFLGETSSEKFNRLIFSEIQGIFLPFCISQTQLSGFLGDENVAGQYAEVLVLLAIQVGFPFVAKDLFSAMRSDAKL